MREIKYIENKKSFANGQQRLFFSFFVISPFKIKAAAQLLFGREFDLAKAEKKGKGRSILPRY